MFRGHYNNLQLLHLWQARQDIRHRRGLGALLWLRDRQIRRRRPRSSWHKSWLSQEQRLQHGMYFQLMRELERNDIPGFVRFIRFEPEMFREIEHRLYRVLLKEDTNMRAAITPAERIAVTLRYLATGENFRSLAFGFRIAHNTISGIIPEVCDAIISEFGPEVMPEEITTDDWKDIADDFETLWNFPNCMGAIDGKHVPIACPKNAGSDYFNYKKFHSIVLLAIVDAQYVFRTVSVGSNGACSDLQIFNETPMKEKIDRGEFEWPTPAPLPNDDHALPYYFIGDDAFALQPWLMKPYSRRNLSHEEQIFNYRLSHARRVVKNAFGILVNGLGVCSKPWKLGPNLHQPSP